MKITAIIRDAEAGNEITRFETVEEARAELQKYEEQDRAEGTYTEGFYEILELEDLSGAKFTVTGELSNKLNEGLADYLADGYIERDGEKIPCQIGFIAVDGLIEATYIFIKDGITENGTRYYAETIEL